MLSIEEKLYLRKVTRTFAGALLVGAFALTYWTKSLALTVVYASSGIALAALANGIASRLYTIVELLQRISNQIESLRRGNQ